MSTYRLDVAYDGTGFHGYASQPNLRTVQGELDTALGHHLRPIKTVVAGRTDKGVHASGQVISFVTDIDVDERKIVRSVNRQLGQEIAVLGLAAVDDDFDARFSATGRRYVYRVLAREAPDPFLARHSLHIETPLDHELMSDSVAVLVGLHDFAAFCRKAPGRSTERLVREVYWERTGDLLELHVEASSYCHQMVRSIAALSIDIGRGKRPPGNVKEVLESGDRRMASGAARALGLTLTAVTY